MTERKQVQNEIQVYALDENGRPIHISQVPDSQNGLACNCTCPICGHKLIARKGHGGKTPHFAHQQDSTCTHPEYIKQSNIHAMAEEIFLEEKEIMLPQCFLEAGNYSARFFDGGKWEIGGVELEKKISDFIPDIILINGEHVLLVEIYVTHAIDEAKRKKIQEADLPVIEINLSDLAHDHLTKDELKSYLHEIARSKWIHLPLIAAAVQNFSKSKQIFSFDGTDKHVKECPQLRFGKELSPNMCERCGFNVGCKDDKVECLYVFRFSPYWGKIPYPKLSPVRESFDSYYPPHIRFPIPIVNPGYNGLHGQRFYQKGSTNGRKSQRSRYSTKRKTLR